MAYVLLLVFGADQRGTEIGTTDSVPGDCAEERDGQCRKTHAQFLESRSWLGDIGVVEHGRLELHGMSLRQWQNCIWKRCP
jgi:hypothetical protein